MVIGFPYSAHTAGHRDTEHKALCPMSGTGPPRAKTATNRSPPIANFVMRGRGRAVVIDEIGDVVANARFDDPMYL